MAESIGLHRIVLKVDHWDAESIREAMARRKSWGVLPDACHDDADLFGRLIAEICRGWLEMLDSIPREE